MNNATAVHGGADISDVHRRFVRTYIFLSITRSSAFSTPSLGCCSCSSASLLDDDHAVPSDVLMTPVPIIGGLLSQASAANGVLLPSLQRAWCHARHHHDVPRRRATAIGGFGNYRCRCRLARRIWRSPAESRQLLGLRCRRTRDAREVSSCRVVLRSRGGRRIRRSPTSRPVARRGGSSAWSSDHVVAARIDQLHRHDRSVAGAGTDVDAVALLRLGATPRRFCCYRRFRRSKQPAFCS